MAIAGATASTLVLAEAQVGKAITVTASYTDGHGTAESVTSAASAAVANVNDAPTGSVTFTGTATQGQTLTAANTLADARRAGHASATSGRPAGVAIAGATASTLVLGRSAGRQGHHRHGQLHRRPRHGRERHQQRQRGCGQRQRRLPTGAVTLTGTATQGQTLTAANTLADLDGLGAVSYQWKADGVAIAGATASTLVLSQAQVGKAITVTASYTDGHGTAESVTSSASAAVANVNDVPTGSVTITGTATQGQTLTAANTLADLDGLGAISYQWKAGGVAISGATGQHAGAGPKRRWARPSPSRPATPTATARPRASPAAPARPWPTSTTRPRAAVTITRHGHAGPDPDGRQHPGRSRRPGHHQLPVEGRRRRHQRRHRPAPWCSARPRSARPSP